MCWLKSPKSLKKKSLMKYVPSSMLPPKRRPNSFSETLKKRDSRISLQSSNVSETLWNPAWHTWSFQKMSGFLSELPMSWNAWTRNTSVEPDRWKSSLGRRPVTGCSPSSVWKWSCTGEAHPSGKHAETCLSSIISIECNFTQKSLHYLSLSIILRFFK